jgi:hypothetical protein
MTDVLKAFSDEVRARDMAEAANMFEYWLQQARNDVHCRHTRNFIKAVTWVAAQSDRTLLERVEQMIRLGELKTPFVGSLRKFTGW